MNDGPGYSKTDETPPDIRTSAPEEPPRPSILASISASAVATWAIAFGAMLALLFLVQVFARPIALLVAGIIIAQALAPIVGQLSRWMKRGIAIGVTYVALLGFVALLTWLVVPALAEQGSDLVEQAPDLYARAQSWIDDNALFGDRFSSEDIEERVINAIGSFGGRLVGLPMTVVSTAFDVLLVVIISVYWIISGPAVRRFFLSLFPFDRQGKADSVVTEMGAVMGGYVRGIVMNAFVIFVLAYIGLTLIGVEYALVLAVIAGLLDIVPVVGPIIATVPIVGIAVLDSPTTGIITFVFWIALQQVESYLVLPFIMKSQAEVPPLIVLLAIYWGGSVGGILGALVAIPVAGALRVFFLRVIAPAIRRWTGAINGDLQGPPQPPLSQVDH